MGNQSDSHLPGTSDTVRYRFVSENREWGVFFMMSTSKIAALIGRPRDHNREDAIESAAIELMREVGYERCTIEAIACRAKASKATIYRRWKNKQELILSAVNRYSFCSSPDISTGNLRDDLVALITEKATNLKGPDGDLISALLTAAKSDSELGRLIPNAMNKNADETIQIMKQNAIKRGEISEAANIALLHDVIPGVIVYRIFMSKQVVDKKFIEQLVDDLLIPAFQKTNTRREHE